MADATSLRRRRWPRRLLIAGFVLAALVFFAPWIAARAGVAQVIADKALADFDGKVTLGSASLGWFRPVELTDIRVQDTQGRTMLTVSRIVTSKSLVALAMDASQLGTVTVERPSAEIVCERNTNNLETALAKILTSPPTSKPKPSFSLEVKDGTLVVKDDEQKREWTWDRIAVNAVFHGDDTEIAFSASCTDRPLAVELGLGANVRAALKAERFPLDALGPLLRRIEPGLSLSGELTADIATTSTDDARHILKGRLGAADFMLVSSRLGAEKLILKTVELPCRVEWTGESVTVQEANLTCDLGRATLKGTIPLNKPMAKSLEASTVAANAELDISQLFALFPELLQLQKETTVREGRLTVVLDHAASSQGGKWTGRLGSNSFVIVSRGRVITWEKPIAAAFRGTLNADYWPDFDSLTITSDFLNARGEGRLEAFKLSADVSLDKLAEHLNQFLDLRGTKFAGNARLDAGSHSDGNGSSTLSSRAMLQNIAVVHRDFRFAGRGDLTATVRFDSKYLSVNGLTGTLENAKFRSLGLDVDEPLVKVLPTDVIIDRTSGRWSLPKLQAATQTVSIGAENIVVAPEGASFKAGINVNLGQLQRTLMLGGEPVHGFVTDGRVEASVINGRQRITARLPIADFRYGSAAKPFWTEKALTLTYEGEFNSKSDALTLDSASLSRPDGVAVTANGTVRELSTMQVLDLTGQLSYDLAAMEPQLRAMLGKSVKAAGRERRPFHLRGAAADPTLLIGDASLGWQSLSAYGFDLTANRLDATLDRGILTTNPVEATFIAGGVVKLKPTLRLKPNDFDLRFDPGRIIDKATLTTNACADVLGFALPAIAKSNKAEGQFSFDLGDHRITLEDASRSTMQGRLTLHNVSVTAGPVIGEIAGLFGQTQPKLTLAQDQVVNVSVEKGRVHHDKLTLNMAGYALSTSGSVGFDGSLNLTIQAPLPESAVGPLLKSVPKIRDAVVNKRITIPLGGTLSKPTLDAAAFRVAVQQFVKEVSKDAAAGKLDELLQKLGPKKP